MPIEAAVGARVPGKPTNVRTFSKTRGVKAKWGAPTSWLDLTTEDWDETEVESYNCVLFRSGVGEVDRVERIKGRSTFFPMTKAEAQLSGYYVEVEAIGHDQDASGLQTTIDAALTPEQIVIGNADLDSGAVDYRTLAGTIGGTRFGYYSSVGTSANRRYITTGAPTGKSGDALFNTYDNRMYKWEASNGYWWQIADGTEMTVGSITADVVRTGALESYTVNAFYINGGTITGTLFRTQAQGTRAEMGGSSYPDRVAIFNSSGLVGSIQGQYLGTVFDDGALVQKSSLMIQAAGAGNNIKIDAGAESIFLMSPLKAGGTIFMGGHHIRMNSGIIYNCNYIEINESAGGDTPAAGKMIIFKEDAAKNVIVKFPDGTRYRLDKTLI